MILNSEGNGKHTDTILIKLPKVLDILDHKIL